MATVPQQWWQSLRGFRAAVPCLISAACAVAALIPCAAVHAASAPPDGECRRPVEAGKFAQADICLRSVLQGNPKSEDAHRLLGYTLYSEQKPQPSLAEYTAAAKLERPTSDDLMAVSADYILLKDYDDAAKWLTVVTQWRPTDARAWYYLGRCDYLRSDYGDAKEALLRALALKSAYVRVETALGLATAAEGDAAGAMTAYRRAIAWQENLPRKDAQPYLSTGQLEEQNGNYAATERDLLEAREWAPENPRVLEHLGRIMAKEGKLASAQAQYQAALRIQPDSGPLHFLLGQVLKARGLQAEADKEFAAAGKLYGLHTSHDALDADAPMSAPESAGGAAAPQ